MPASVNPKTGLREIASTRKEIAPPICAWWPAAPWNCVTSFRAGKPSREHTLATIEPQGVFGWSALVPPFTITLSSYCGEQGATILRFSGKLLVGVFEREPRIGYICMRNLSRVIANRFRRMEDEVARLEGLNLMHQW